MQSKPRPEKNYEMHHCWPRGLADATKVKFRLLFRTDKSPHVFHPWQEKLRDVMDAFARNIVEERDPTEVLRRMASCLAALNYGQMGNEGFIADIDGPAIRVAFAGRDMEISVPENFYRLEINGAVANIPDIRPVVTESKPKEPTPAGRVLPDGYCGVRELPSQAKERG